MLQGLYRRFVTKWISRQKSSDSNHIVIISPGPDKSWQIRTYSDKSGHIQTNPDKSWPIRTNPDKFWQIQTNPDLSGQILTNPYISWQIRTNPNISGNILTNPDISKRFHFKSWFKNPDWNKMFTLSPSLSALVSLTLSISLFLPP